MARENRNNERGNRFTKHAQERVQQRGIPKERIDIVIRFGERKWSRGARSVHMTKRARLKAARHLGKHYAQVADKLNFYLIICPHTGAVRTVAPRKRRLRRK